MQMALLYTCCMDLYSSVTYVSLQVTQAVYTSYVVAWCLVQYMYNSESFHGSTPYQGDHSDAKYIFVHLLYRSLQLPYVYHVTGTTDCVNKL